VCVCICVCMYVRMYVCMYVCVYVVCMFQENIIKNIEITLEIFVIESFRHT